MDIEFIWKSLKNEDAFTKGGRSTSVTRKSIKPIACGSFAIPRSCSFDIDVVANELLTVGKPKDREWDDKDLDSCNGTISWLHINEAAVNPHIDSDDEDEAEDNTPSKEQVANSSWRVERLAKALGSDIVSDRVQSLVKLKETIESLRLNLPLPAEMKYPPPYDSSMITLNRNLPLVSDFVKPQLLESTHDAHTTQERPSLTNHDDTEATARLQVILNTCGNSLFRLIGDSKSEICRGLAISCVQSLLLASLDVGRHIPFMIPALCARYPPSSYDKDMEVFIQDNQSHEFYKRGGATDRQDRNRINSQVVEPSEELRIELCRTFACLMRGVLASGAERILDKYYPDIIFALQSSLRDPFPELNIEACNILVQLLRIPHWEQGAKYFATGLARSALPNCRHRNSNVMIAAMDLFEASVCVPDKAKVKGAGTTAIADLVGYQADNVLPIAAFYDPKYNVSVNTLAELAIHKNYRVRLRCCEMLSYFLVYLPDRYDHQPRLLPYILTFINDDVPAVQMGAFDCIEKCGLQYECEHPDDIIERRQFGVDGDETIDYDSNLPKPFLHRPSLGARLFIRVNTNRIFLAVLNELSNWREHTRKRSAELLLILTVYCEEHLTKDFQYTISSIAKAINAEKSSKIENDHLRILDTIQQVLRLMAKYIDPASYVPLMCPRISGDNSSATSNSEDGCHSERSRSIHATILKALIEGAPLRRLLLHWVSLASLLTNTDCIGPYVGTQTRHECLSALRSLTAKVMSDTGCVEDDFLSHFTNAEGDLPKLHSVLSSSGLSLRKLLRSNAADEDAGIAQECIDSQLKILASITTDRI